MSDWHVYILRCADDTLYTGITTDLARRLRQHNQSPAGARYTRARRPVELVYSETLASKGDALRREHAIKQLDRAAKLQLLESTAPLPEDTDMTFSSLGLIQPLQHALDQLGHHTPTPVQAQAIPIALAGHDLIAAAQTGTGKTGSFSLPMLQKLSTVTPASANHVRALVLTPTRELAQQVADNLQDYGRYLPLRVVVAYGGVSLNPQMMALRKGADILVATPGRLLDLHSKNALKLGQLQILVLDEADRMLDLGFSRELNQILELLPKRRQTMLFSATFSDPIRELAGKLLQNPKQVDASPRNTTVAAVKQWIIPVDKQRKLELFCHLLRKHRWPQVLVFAKTRKRVDELVTSLGFQQVSCDAIHGDITQSARLAALKRFNAGEVRILVATDVAARGLDIESLPLVVNLDLPIGAEGYVHRIGRTGRAGQTGEAISLVCADEANQLAAIENLIGKVLSRREIQGFEPNHRVPATGPGKRPPSAKDVKDAKGKSSAKKKKKKTPGKRKAEAAAKPRQAAPAPAAASSAPAGKTRKPRPGKPASSRGKGDAAPRDAGDRPPRKKPSGPLKPRTRQGSKPG